MQVLILGSLELIDDNGVAIALNGPKIRALTALLALDPGRVVSTDKLIDGIYGEDQPLRAGNALQLQVSKLRATLRSAEGAEKAVVTRPPGYLLDIPDDDVDALRFTRLVSEGRRTMAADPAGASALFHQALGLWRGPALADFSFDDFATGDRVRLDALRLAALEDCIEADLDLGRHVECIDHLEQLVAAHPLRERAWGQLMVALYRAGRQAESLRAFARARHHLGEELGIDPGPELRRLEAAVLAQDPSLAGPSRPAPAPANAAPPRTLDRPLTACIGREAELAQLHAMLQDHRLVTLVGPGGTGKTRLAVEVALSERFDGDVLLVDLAPVTDAQGVHAAMRTALGRHSSHGAPALVVLDNCEHVVLDAAHAAADLVSAHPQVRVLATSREGLGVPGEMLFPVPPLDQAAAVRLFTERAQAAAPALHLDERSVAAVADICVRLDGLPLAIELAAARTRALDVTQIANRLNGRFQLLTAGPRTLLPRQRTLRAVVDWSYDLLDPLERLLFERLSVFSGSAGLESVEAVCAGEGIDTDDVADLLSRLVDKSLVLVGRSPQGTRYSMLQTLGAYAGERLAASGTADTYRARHTTWLLGLAAAAERGAGSTPSVTLAELDAEIDELDAALVWARGQDPRAAFELASRLGWFWFWTGRVDAGWQVLSDCLQEPVDVADEIRSRAAAWGGMLGTIMQVSGMGEMVDSAVSLARASGAPGAIGQALAIRSTLAVLQGRPAGDLADASQAYTAAGDRHGQAVIALLQGMAAGSGSEAGPHYARSVELFRAAGDDWAAGVPLQRIAELAETRRDADGGTVAEPAFYQALVRAQLASARSRPASGGDDDETAELANAVADHIRGRVTMRGDRPGDARADLELALRRYRSLGNTAAASTCLSDLGRMAQAMGENGDAVRSHAQATEAAIEAGDHTVVLSALEGLSAALSAGGAGERAGQVLGAADVLRDSGLRPWDPAVDERAATEAAATRLLGVATLGRLRSEGRSRPIEALLDGLLA